MNRLITWGVNCFACGLCLEGSLVSFRDGKILYGFVLGILSLLNLIIVIARYKQGDINE